MLVIDDGCTFGVVKVAGVPCAVPRARLPGGDAMIARGLVAVACAVLLPGMAAPRTDHPAGALARQLRDGGWHQVRIEQHLIIRISPGDPGLMHEPLPSVALPQVALRERRIAPCLPVAGIAAVRPLSDRSIALILRDRRLVSADLSRTCSGRDFYLGFYVASTADGQLCAKRDLIHSRAGPSCTITRVRELVPQY